MYGDFGACRGGHAQVFADLHSQWQRHCSACGHDHVRRRDDNPGAVSEGVFGGAVHPSWCGDLSALVCMPPRGVMVFIHISGDVPPPPFRLLPGFCERLAWAGCSTLYWTVGAISAENPIFPSNAYIPLAMDLVAFHPLDRELRNQQHEKPTRS